MSLREIAILHAIVTQAGYVVIDWQKRRYELFYREHVAYFLIVEIDGEEYSIDCRENYEIGRFDRVCY